MGATMYAHVDHDGTITEWRLPGAARRSDTREWVMGLPDAPEAMRQACGWFAVKPTPRPADTATTTYERSIALLDGVPTVTWTPRAKTADELAAATATTNIGALEAKARAALIANNTFLALAAPGNTDVLKQVRALTRQMTALIRLSLRGDLLDDTTGT